MLINLFPGVYEGYGLSMGGEACDHFCSANLAVLCQDKKGFGRMFSNAKKR